MCLAVQLGHYPAMMFFQCIAATTLFYSAHWQTYVSGTLRFGAFDVTEAQFTIMLVHLISAIFGTEIWALKVGTLDCHSQTHVSRFKIRIGELVNFGFNCALIVLY